MGIGHWPVEPAGPRSSLSSVEMISAKKPMRMIRVLTMLTLIGLTGSVLAGPGGAVDVRVFDHDGGALSAESRVGLEQRLVLDATQEDQHYLGFRRALLRGQDVLEISLAGRPDVWQSRGYTAWNEPAVNRYGRLRVETVPVGWAGRFCQAYEVIDAPAERDDAIQVNVNGELYLSRPGWPGSGEVDLLKVDDVQTGPLWQARLDADDQLYLRQAGAQRWQPVGPVRDDFFMVRELSTPAGRIELGHVPGNYADRFCERYREQGEAYAQLIADYALGRH